MNLYKRRRVELDSLYRALSVYCFVNILTSFCKSLKSRIFIIRNLEKA